MRRLSRQLVLLTVATILSLAFVGSCPAGSYRWTDRDGTLHFSDALPAEDIPRESLSPVDPEQRPLLVKPVILYRDPVFVVTLEGEEDDELQFSVDYSGIHHAYPELVRSPGRLLLSAVDRGNTPTYLSFTVAPVAGGSDRLTLTNAMTRHTESHLETVILRLTLSLNDRERDDRRILFTTDIPFVKHWQKREGVAYR